MNNDLENQFDLLNSSFDGVTGKFFDAAWNGINGYTEMLAMVLEISRDLLDWFAFECKFGATPTGASINDEEMQDIASIEMFVDFIERLNETSNTE